MFETSSAYTNESATTRAASSGVVEDDVPGGVGGWASSDLPDDLGDVVLQRAAVPVDPAIYGIEDETSEVHGAAARGIATPSSELPFLARIQASFGAHDVSQIRSHVGGTCASEMGARAFAAGDHVVFDREPDLHTAAHEAAHVVQQARGVNLYGGVGEAGDAYERAADAVADRVVAGRSAVDLLGAPTGGFSASPSAVQRKEDPSLLRQRADGHRAQTVSAHLRLGAMKIEHECDVVTAAVEGPPGNPTAAMTTVIEPAYARVDEVYRTLVPILEDLQRLGFRDGAIRAGFGIFNSAKRRFYNVTQQARVWAERNKLESKSIDSGSIDRTAKRFAGQLGVESQGPKAEWGKENAATTQADLIKETVVASLDAAEASVEALASAMRQDDAKTASPPLAQRALVDLRLFDASIPPDARTSPATATRVARIAQKMQQAFRDASHYNLHQSDANLIAANGLMATVKAKIDRARGAK